MPETVLVVAAHPDDEILGCGGTMARHVKAGDRVHIAILAEGETSRRPTRNPAKDRAAIGKLAVAAKRAQSIVGAASLYLDQYPDNRMDSVDLLDVVKTIEKLVDRLKPTIIYTHWRSDLNVDHCVIHDAVMTACRPLPGCRVKSIFCFEVPSSTEWRPAGTMPAFEPQYFVDISKTLKTKLKALDAYGSEMRPWPHARSIEAVEHLARWRGATVGIEAAEAFAVARAIVSP